MTAADAFAVDFPQAAMDYILYRFGIGSRKQADLYYFIHKMLLKW